MSEEKLNKPKYELGDCVWLMKDNKCCRKVIHGITTKRFYQRRYHGDQEYLCPVLEVIYHLGPMALSREFVENPTYEDVKEENLFSSKIELLSSL